MECQSFGELQATLIHLGILARVWTKTPAFAQTVTPEILPFELKSFGRGKNRCLVSDLYGASIAVELGQTERR